MSSVHHGPEHISGPLYVTSEVSKPRPIVDNGAILEPVIEGDRVVGVKIIKPGIGFSDFPDIEVVSDTGYNAEFTPIFKIVDPETLEEIPETATIIQVIDCVGKV